MPKLTVNKAAEQAEANEVKSTPNSVDIIDARGRTITVKKPHFLAQFHLTKALGDTARNTTYMMMISPVLHVAAIDGDPVSIPTSEKEAEAILQRLDEDGYAAVMQAIEDHFAPNGNGADREQIKN